MKFLAVMTLLLFGLQNASANTLESDSLSDSLTSDILHSEELGGDEPIPGCVYLKSLRSVMSFAIQSEDADISADDVMQVKAAFRALCSTATPQKGATVYYPNGRTATSYARTLGATWFFPNGRTITSYAGQTGATWFYPNGRTVTSYMGQTGATWFYPNGRTMTSYYGQKGATWFYPNGRTITSYAGTQGATWFYSNGRTLSSYFGRAGATWFYADGSTWTTSGVEISEESLLYPHWFLAALFDDEGAL